MFHWTAVRYTAEFHSEWNGSNVTQKNFPFWVIARVFHSVTRTSRVSSFPPFPQSNIPVYTKEEWKIIIIIIFLFLSDSDAIFSVLFLVWIFVIACSSGNNSRTETALVVDIISCETPVPAHFQVNRRPKRSASFQFNFKEKYVVPQILLTSSLCQLPNFWRLFSWTVLSSCESTDCR